MPHTLKKFYLTTPIYYVNARPHIGHAYSTIAADVIARRHRLLGDDTFFLTGTDEHGQKVQRSAEAAGIPPQQFTDEVSATFQNLWKRMGITNDDYIRTTDARHKRGVQKLWRDLEARGAIYLSTYTGQYSVGEEMFVEGPPGTIGPDGKPTETVTEENYFFRLSDYQQPIIDLIESGQLHIQPEAVRNEVLSFVRGDLNSVLYKDEPKENREALVSDVEIEAVNAGNLRLSLKGTLYVPGALKDLSISRTTFDWGIPVPGNPKHVIYVWLDALANYMTAVGYGSDDPADRAKFARYWPADLHLVGKEITRFHCVYWPAFLLALNPKLQHGPKEPTPQLTPAEHAEWAAKWVPKSVVANGWLLFEESKMSKSRGNVVRTETILDAFGPLCPPVPLVHTTDAVILSERSESKDPDAASPTDAARTISAAEPDLAAPTKAQQDLFAADVIRYFLLREIPFGQDGSFSFDALITRYNADLANGYGNLVSRTLALIQQNFSGVVPQEKLVSQEPDDTWTPLMIHVAQHANGIAGDMNPTPSGLFHPFEDSLDNYEFHDAIWLLLKEIASVDGFLTETKPWKLAKVDDPSSSSALATSLYTAAESIRIITALLYPVMPYATASVWCQLGLGDIEEAARNGELKDLKWGGLKPGTKLGPLAPIFPRADKGLAQIMTEMESPAPTPETRESVKSVAGSTPAPTPEKSVQSVSSALSSPPAETPEATPTITIDDFAKIDLRVAQIVVAERIPKADKLLRLEVDLGYEKRQILSGIAEFYTPEELIGKRIAIIANLAPRKMRGLESHGMLLAASGEDHSSKPILATFSDEVPLGSKIR